MAGLSRREFLLSMAALPFVKLAIPPLAAGLSAGLAGARQAEGGAKRPNILMVVFDAFSAQNVSLYGYRRATTPNLSRLAERATVFHQHRAGGNYTSPGTATLLTGLYPWTHRCLQLYGHVLESVADNNVFNLMPDDYYKVAYTHNPLAESLLTQFASRIDQLPPREALSLSDALWADGLFPKDYPIAIHAEKVLDGQSRPSSAPIFRALQFLRTRADVRHNKRAYAEEFPRGVPNSPFDADFILEDAIDWVNELSTTLDNPYFAYVHMFPPHSPYNTRREFIDIFNDGWNAPAKEANAFFTKGAPEEQLAYKRQRYDEFVAYVDAEFGRLFDQLERNGALENTYVIMTSDHGELFERGLTGHAGMALYDAVVHVPLMIWQPGQTQRVDVTERTSAVDILPTILHWAGQPIPALCEGTVLPTFSDEARPAERSVFSVEAMRNNAFAPLSIGTLSLFQDRYKLISYTGYPELPSKEPYYELFDLENDPEERENLFPSQKALADDLRAQLAHRVEEANAPFRRA